MSILPRSRPLTRADLESMPDDGHRYELVDGTLVVTPAPSTRHQRAVFRVARLLDDRCPDETEVLIAPFDVALSDDTVLQPDVLVARRSDLTERDLPTRPLLAVEVLSPSTRHVDLSLKSARYESAGCRRTGSSIPTCPGWSDGRLRGSAYQQVADVTGDDAFVASTPFAVTVRLGALGLD